ncbi:hypothetical protein F4679DRAFT_594550 [Xylaria curta]|nr:hypothetical protein F4679DRAFT_594550 [Xylaria curta]
MLSQPFILQLPCELCDKLVKEYHLPRKDIESLRCTCEAFATIAKPLLYERVVLSRLIEDRDEFEKIGKEYGRHVREVIWQGLDLEFWLNNLALTRYLTNEAHPSILAASVARNSNLIWIQPRLFTDVRIGKEWQTLVDWISKQIDDLPNMTTLTIKPMPETRAFGSDVEKVPRFWTQPQNFESTIFDFILALLALGRPSCRVRTLNLDNRFRETDILEALLGCILRAKNLRNLKLCFASALANAYHEPEPFLRKLFCGDSWPHLHTLHLVNLESFLIILATERSKRLVGLRHLTLDDCTIRPSTAEYFKREQLYTQLESITIRAHTVFPRRRFPKLVVSGPRVLAFLRNEVADLGPDINSKTRGELVTDARVPPCQLCLRPRKRE